jgi:hypothetical protein
MRITQAVAILDKIAWVATKHSALCATHVFITNRLPPLRFQLTVTLAALELCQEIACGNFLALPLAPARGIGAESPQDLHWQIRGLAADSPVFLGVLRTPKKTRPTSYVPV